MGWKFETPRCNFDALFFFIPAWKNTKIPNASDHAIRTCLRHWDTRKTQNVTGITIIKLNSRFYESEKRDECPSRCVLLPFCLTHAKYHTLFSNYRHELAIYIEIRIHVNIKDIKTKKVKLIS